MMNDLAKAMRRWTGKKFGKIIGIGQAVPSCAGLWVADRLYG
jgi:hypothetical protein